MANTLQLVVAVDTSGGNAAINRFNSTGLGSVEQHAVAMSRRATQSFSGIEREAVRVAASVQSSFGGLGKIFAAVGGAGLAKTVFDIAAGFERSRIGLQAFLGDATKAQAFFEDIQKFALKSPFQFGDLLEQSRQLLAFSFSAKESADALRAISATGGALNFDRGKFADLVNAFGQIRAAGRLTGEELRQLRNAGVPALDILSKAFAKTGAETQEAIEKGLIPADQAIRVLTRGLEERFGRFNSMLQGTASVALSNFLDALQKIAEVSTRNFLPGITSALNDLIPALDALGAWVRDNVGALKGFAVAIGEIGVALAAYKIAAGIGAISFSLQGLAAVAAGNPFALIAAGVALVGAELYRQNAAWREWQGLKIQDDKIRALVRDGKTAKELESLGVSAEAVKKAFSKTAIDGSDAFTFDKSTLPQIRVVMANEQQAAAQREVWAADRKKAAQDIANAEQRAHQLLEQARRSEFTGLADIIAEYRVYREELGKSRQANLDLAQATVIRLKTEAAKELKSNAADTIKGIQEEYRTTLEFRARQFQESLAFASETNQMLLESTEQRLAAESEAVKFARDRRMALLEGEAAQTVAQKLDVEQRRLAIEQDFIRQSAELQQQALDRRAAREIQALQAMASAMPALAAETEQRIAAIRERSLGERQGIEMEAARELDLTRIQAGARSVQIIRDNTRQVFDQIKSTSDRVFGDMLRNGQGIFAALGSSLKNAVLTALREIVSSQVARSLTRILTGESVTFAGGASSGGGLLGNLGRMLGGLGVGSSAVLGANGAAGRLTSTGAGAFGASGIAGLGGLIGAPGGTSGFAGPVSGVGATAIASRGGGLLQMLGIGGSIQTGAGTATTFGAASLTQKLGAIGKSNAALAAGGLLAFDGLRRGGALGLAETTAGGALIGFRIGGPLGAAIGAGAGAAAGFIRLFVKGAQDKIVEKVRALYGISISKEFARDPLLGIIKSQFGGNIELGIRSPQVRDLIELYGMSTGAGNGPLSDRMRPLSFRDLGRGGLQEVPGFFNGAPRLTVAGGAAVGPAPVVIQSVQLVVGEDSAAAFMRGEIAPVVADSPGAVSTALQTANRLSIGRRDALATQFGMVTA